MPFRRPPVAGSMTPTPTPTPTPTLMSTATATPMPRHGLGRRPSTRAQTQRGGGKGLQAGLEQPVATVGQRLQKLVEKLDVLEVADKDLWDA